MDAETFHTKPFVVVEYKLRYTIFTHTWPGTERNTFHFWFPLYLTCRYSESTLILQAQLSSNTQTFFYVIFSFWQAQMYFIGIVIWIMYLQLLNVWKVHTRYWQNDEHVF